ncbi:MAG: glycosyltransferase family 4 protein [Methanotrichaceae archaeon]|nr:glycosyltransferase family 4 protein [Methanotrichaceae archaeon]
MRIGMFSWESLYSVKVGGVAPHVSEISEALARRGHEVHIFTRRGDFDSYDRINGVHYQRVDSDSSGDILYQMDKMCDSMFDRFGAVQRLFGDFDVVHGHDWHPVRALKRIKDVYSIPMFLTMHSTEWGRNGNNFGDGVSKQISHLEWMGCYESSLVIVTTRRMVDELKWIYSLPEDKIRIIPNGIMKGKMRRSLDAGRVKERLGIHPLAPVILFCGRMSFQKGPDLLVEAIPKILSMRPDARFVFIGEGGMKADCERRASELGVKDACRFLGYTSGADKEELMNACDLVCMPSRNEPFGVVVLEAWDACKPLVATEAISIVKNFDDGLLAYIQPESIAWCINRLLSHPEEMKKLASAGCERIDAEFSWDRIAKRTEVAYESILRPPDGS